MSTSSLIELFYKWGKIELMKIVFWGTGDTARRHMDVIEKLSNKFDIVAFTDGGQKSGDAKLFWEGYRLIPPEAISDYEADYLCILSIWEWEIRKRIYDEKLFELSKILSFHEICMMDSFGMDINCSYKELFKSIYPKQVYSSKMWRDYEYLKRNYSYVLCDSNFWSINGKKKRHFEENTKPIWILWLQGFEAAPDVVKICIHSIKRELGKEECICLLDKDNLFEYIDLPDYIVQKWQSGIIDHTHFSDLVRLRLLNVYGGIWIDATVYFTGNKLADYIKSSNLFMFSIQGNWRAYTEPRIAANWLIGTQPENKLLLVLESLHNEYWKKENKVINYFFFHIFWTIVTERFPHEWNQAVKLPRDPAQLLVRELSCKFDSFRFNLIKQMSDIHKLSNKIPYININEKSFWDVICEAEGCNEKG